MEPKGIKYWDIGHRPQDDVPKERITHYIIKDYRRMFNTYQALLEKAKEFEGKMKAAQEKNLKMNSQMNAERQKYKEAIRQLQESRSAVVDAVVEDLEDEIKELKRQNRLLAEAVAGGNQENVRVIRETINLNSPSEREWMKRSMKQLEQANQKLDSTVNLLSEAKEFVEQVVEIGYNEEKTAPILKKVGKAQSKLESALSHIDTFFEKTSKLDLGD